MGVTIDYYAVTIYVDNNRRQPFFVHEQLGGGCLHTNVENAPASLQYGTIDHGQPKYNLWV